MPRLQLSLRRARSLVFGMLVLSIVLGVGRTFFDPDLTGAVMGISAAPVFYWLYRNPALLLAKNFDEFCKRYDEATHMEFLKGFPLYYAILGFAVIYILVTR